MTPERQRNAPDGDHTYHHGNLRRALLDEALVMIGESGVDALTLRNLARRTGVTHAAPRHHFADKAALITALAYEGLDAMAVQMRESRDLAGDDPAERLLAVGRAYVLFATDHPDYFAVMFRPEPATQPLSADAPDRSVGAWLILVEAIVRCQESGLVVPGDPTPVAIYLWSLVHGLASLWVFGPLRSSLPPEVADIRELTDLVLRQTGRYLAGTGPSPTVPQSTTTAPNPTPDGTKE